jgi:hypothetical protein
VFIYALVNHFYIYFPLQSFLKKKVKDRQFHSSIKFGVGIITPILQIIQSLIFAIFLPDYFWYYLASLPISAYIALVYKYYYRRLLKQIRYYIFKVFNRKRYLKLRKEATELQDQILEYL